MYGTARNTQYGYSLWEFQVFGTATAPPTGGSLGANVVVFDQTMAQSSIQNTLTTISNQQGTNEFGTQRYELLFKPGTYGSAASPLNIPVGFYEAFAGLGRNPGDVVINGSIDSYNQCTNGVQTQCYATTNFWRSVSNLTINVAGKNGCYANTDFWATSQAAPLRRVVVNGALSPMDFFTGSPDWASGGFIADSKVTGTITNGSQQQFMTRNTSIGSWSNGVWNQVFCGDPGAPAQSFSANSGLSGGTAPYTTLANCPVTREAPYLYLDSAGNYNVSVPSAAPSSNGPSWAAGITPGTSLPLSTFYVVNSASTVAQINAALMAGDNLLFTPGVYSIGQTLTVPHADTKIVGLGFPTLVAASGNTTISVADVQGVAVSGLIFDAGPTTEPTLLQVGRQGSTADNAADPVSIQDVFFRIGGVSAGSATVSLVDNSNNSIIDNVWAWRADHGSGVGWTANTADTEVVVNGNNVTSYGLAVEHYQKNETVWNGQGGTVIFFQNENPYDVPSQAAGARAALRRATRRSTSPTVSRPSRATAWVATASSTRASTSRRRVLPLIHPLLAGPGDPGARLRSLLADRRHQPTR